MYHPTVIAARVRQLFAAAPSLRGEFPDGLPAYGVEESRAYTAALMEVRKPDGSLTRTLTSDEQTFIAATQLRCQIDFPYFGERFVWIDQEGHGLRPLYPLWESQRLVLAQMGRIELARRSASPPHPDGILINVLKARQLGVSTLSAALLAHRIVTQPYTRGLEGADVEEQAGYLFRMAARVVDHLPWFLQPARTSFVKNREMTFANASYLKTAWGKSSRGALVSTAGEGTKGAIGRGQTYSVVHISELATWDNPAQLNSALFPAIPVHADTLVVLESTAEHAGDWWHQQWLASAEGHGRFANVFIPWYAEPGKYSLPAPESWSPLESTAEHAKTCEADAPRWLGRPYQLTRDQLYWYETTRAYYARMGQLHKFQKEYPANDEECFQYAGRAIFTIEQLQAIDAAGKRRPLRDVWTVDPALEIAAARRDTPALPAVRDPRPSPPLAPKQPGSWSPHAADLFPVPPGYGFQRLTPAQMLARGEGSNGTLDHEKLLRSGCLGIWEYPRRLGRFDYVMAVDVGEGLGQDYSIVDVIRLGTIEEPAEQVAQFCSAVHSTKELAGVCDAIGRFYLNPDGQEALAAIEINNCGLAVQDLLQLHLGYTRFYVWEYADAGDPAKRYSTKIGWVTSTRTRPMLIAHYYSAVTATDPVTGLPDLILNSPVTRGELRHFVTEGTIGEAAAALGQHDDAVMASAIGTYVAWRLAGGEEEPIDDKRRRRNQARSLAAAAKPGLRRDWRNTAVSAASGGGVVEDDDEQEFADGTSGGSGISYFGGERNRI